MRKPVLAFCLLFIFFGSDAQKIKGVITDKDGNRLPFATVFVKGTLQGTHSNNEGKYSMKLDAGRYTLVCQHVGFAKQEISIVVQNEDLEINFTLSLQEMTLDEVVLNQKEDPAYGIIRNAIRKKDEHQETFNRFSCEVYTKGQLRLRNYPDKFLGQKIDFEDGDTSKRKIIYLSETISTYSADGPGKEKVEVLSSKVSGQSDGFGLSAPRFFSFYRNSIQIGNNLNPRGFISPIAENALNYYSYKLEGTYFDEGREINHIRVTPRRKYEPLFSGYIDIVAEEWRIHSVKLLLTKESQMELADSIRLEQLYRPMEGSSWFISSQVMYPVIKMFGFDAHGSFVNIYSRINTNPEFGKKYFGSTILKYGDSSNKKSADYWDRNRPVPLMEDEQKDYLKKDSLEMARKDPRYLDSLDRRRNKVTPMGILLTGESFSNSKKRSTIIFPSLTESVSFNPAEGWVLNPSVTWFKRLDTVSASRKSIMVSQHLRYGFGNRHLNPYLTVQYSYGKKYSHSIRLSGGRRVFQFNNDSPIGERGNTISTLWEENNRIKSYEAGYFRGSYRQAIGGGMNGTIGFQFQDRTPLDNVTDYTWRNKAGREYSPNYPHEIMQSNILRHQAFVLMAGLSWQPGTRYVELPDRKFSVGSKYPFFTIQYLQGIAGVFGSDAKFSKWKFTITDGLNLKLAGRSRYRIGLGGFLSSDSVEVPDYTHFNGNLSSLATEYLNSFQLLQIYRFSNTAGFYSLLHYEHNFNGFLTNKIPGFRKLNLYLVTGVNGLYIDRSRNYFEWFVGFDNILKQLRVDFVQSYIEGRPNHSGIRIGLRANASRRDDW